MKKLILATIIAVLVLIPFALAAAEDDAKAQIQAKVNKIITNLQWLTLVLAGVVAVGGAAMIAMGGGDEAKRQNGINTIKWAIIGGVLAEIVQYLVKLFV